MNGSGTAAGSALSRRVFFGFFEAKGAPFMAVPSRCFRPMRTRRTRHRAPSPSEEEVCPFLPTPTHRRRQAVPSNESRSISLLPLPWVRLHNCHSRPMPPDHFFSNP